MSLSPEIRPLFTLPLLEIETGDFLFAFAVDG